MTRRQGGLRRLQPPETPLHPSSILIRREILGPAARITGLCPDYPSTGRPAAFSALSLCPSRTWENRPVLQPPARNPELFLRATPALCGFRAAARGPGCTGAQAFDGRGRGQSVSCWPPGIRDAGARARFTTKINKMFDQLLLVLGAREIKCKFRQWPHSPALCSRYFGFVRPVPFLQSHIVTWFRAIPFPCASLGTRSRILSHGLGRFHSPAHRWGHGVAYCHMVFMASPFPCASLGIRSIVTWFFMASPFPVHSPAPRSGYGELSHGFLWRVLSPAYRSGHDLHSPANRFLFFRIACCPNNCHLIERLIATVLTNLTRFLFFL